MKIYNAFISHNSADRPAVESVTAALEAQGLVCFLDKWGILPSDQWLRDLENGLANSRTILIFIGTSGIGPGQSGLNFLDFSVCILISRLEVSGI